MQFELSNTKVSVFTISPRTKSTDEYWPNIENCIKWSDAHNATGILLFEGNDTYVSPWVAAQSVFAQSATLCPLVAVNPIYMHPFSVAKLINSYAQIYGRKTYLNMITGTALSYLHAMDDSLDHDQRYDRLREYAEVIVSLLSHPHAIRYAGDYYQLENLKLEPPTDAELMPEFFFAGSSDAATKTSESVGGVQMTMLPNTLTTQQRGVHFGIVCRESEAEAWEAANEIFPEDRKGARMQALTMSNTDAQWKQRLMQASKLGEAAAKGYWLRPFTNFQADCPYLVGSFAEVAEVIERLVLGGVRDFILDLPAAESEFANTALVFAMARDRLQRNSE